MNILKATTLSAMLFGLNVSAAAMPIQWTVYDAIFNDGGAVKGSFVFDATTGAFSNIDLKTLPGFFFDGANYGQTSPYHAGNEHVLLPVSTASPDLTDAYILSLFFTSPLTDAGGTIPLLSGLWNSRETYCGNQACNSGNAILRHLVSGYVTTVPVPAAAWLFGSALGVLLWVRRKPA